MENEHKKELARILGIHTLLDKNHEVSWAEIYREIGILQEKANHKCSRDMSFGALQPICTCDMSTTGLSSACPVHGK